MFNPAGLSECLREWEDLKKDYQQIQVSKRDAHPCYPRPGKLAFGGYVGEHRG